MSGQLPCYSGALEPLSTLGSLVTLALGGYLEAGSVRAAGDKEGACGLAGAPALASLVAAQPTNSV